MTLPELIAHRGYAARYSENTLIGIEAAIRGGARYVEIDVQLSADGVPVLFHDATLHRICGVPGTIHEHPFAALARLRASEFERFGYRYASTTLAGLAQFRDLLVRFPQVTAFVEAKPIAVERFGVDAVLNAIARELAPLAARCVLISFSIPLLKEARRRMRSGGTTGWHALGAVIGHWGERGAARDLRPEFLFCDVRGLPRFWRLEFEGARLAVYEVADAGVALGLARRGVQLVETFALPELREEIRILAAAP